MRSLRTANSLTSRNISSAPPALTLMLYHYSVATPPSQGSAPPAYAFLHPHRHCPCLVLGDVPLVRSGLTPGYRNSRPAHASIEPRPFTTPASSGGRSHVNQTLPRNPGHPFLDGSLDSPGPRTRPMDLAGKTEEPPGLAKGLARHPAPAGDGWIHQGARCALLVLPQGRRRQTTQHLRFCLRRKSQQEPRLGNVPHARRHQ